LSAIKKIDVARGEDDDDDDDGNGDDDDDDVGSSYRIWRNDR